MSNKLSPISKKTFQTFPYELLGNEKMFPYELIGNIFSYLVPKEIDKCSRVCKFWNKTANKEYIWKEIAERGGFYEVIQSFFEKLKKTTDRIVKEICSYSGLFPFIDRIVKEDIIRDKIFNKDNELEEKLEVKGYRTFYVKNFKDIIVENKGIIEKTLKGSEKDEIFKLLLDKNYLFSFKRDGKIVMWNYKKGEIIKTIDTIASDAKKNLESIKKKLGIRDDNGFNKLLQGEGRDIYVNDGYIVIKHKYSYGPKQDFIIEIIPYLKIEKKNIFKIKDVKNNDFLCKILAEEKKELYTLVDKKIVIFDLVKSERKEIKLNKVLEEYRCEGIHLDKNFIILIFENNDYFIIDKKTEKIFKGGKLEEYLFIGSTKNINNILFFNRNGFSKFYIFNMRTNKTIKQYREQNEIFEYDKKYKWELKSSFLREYVDIMKKNMKFLKQKKKRKLNSNLNKHCIIL